MNYSYYIYTITNKQKYIIMKRSTRRNLNSAVTGLGLTVLTFQLGCIVWALGFMMFKLIETIIA